MLRSGQTVTKQDKTVPNLCGPRSPNIQKLLMVNINQSNESIKESIKCFDCFIKYQKLCNHIMVTCGIRLLCSLTYNEKIQKIYFQVFQFCRNCSGHIIKEKTESIQFEGIIGTFTSQSNGISLLYRLFCDG